eukprot:3849507-Rhodomonas_salina.1
MVCTGCAAFARRCLCPGAPPPFTRDPSHATLRTQPFASDPSRATLRATLHTRLFTRDSSHARCSGTELAHGAA